MKRSYMKVSKIATSLLGVALLCSASVFAADVNKGSLHLDDKVTVDGTPVNPGDYRVEWTGSGPDVQATILKGKQTVASFPAHITEQNSPNAANAYASSDQPDGAKKLTAIYFGGKRFSLQVEQNAASQQTNTNPSK
jgi:type 1 fimbria pilin